MLAYKMLCSGHSGAKYKKVSRKKIMKKSAILIAAFAVIISVASVAMAEEFNMDFDMGAFRSADFMEAIKNVSKTDDAIDIKPVPADASNAANMIVYKLAAPGLEELKKEILNRPGLHKEVFRLVNDERTVVLHNAQGVFLTAQVGKSDYYTLFESNDRELIEFLSKRKTEALQAELNNKNWVTTCLPYVKTLWKWVQGIWTAYEVTEYLCHQDWEGDPLPPVTPGGGHGGGALPNLPINPPVRK